MRRVSPFLMAIFLALGAQGSVRAGGLTTGADFLTVPPGARPDAMGQAFCAIADDVNAFVYNPAGLGLLRFPEAGYSRYEFVAGIHFDYLAAAVPLGKPGVVGLAYQALGVAPFNSTGDPAAGTVSASEKMILLGWGKSFGRVQGGLSVKKVKRDLDGWERGGVGVDVGLRWVPRRNLTVAADLMNLGPVLSPARGSLYPATWRAGVAYRLVEHTAHSLDVASDGVFGQRNREVRWGAGGEYWYRERCALRAGYALDSLDSQQEGAVFGAGFRWQGFQLDYSIHPFASLGTAHRFSGLFRWEGSWLPDVEQVPPTFLKVFAVEPEARAEWRAPRGFSGSYEIVRVTMASGSQEVLGPFERPPVFLTGSTPGEFYKVFVRSVGVGGKRSLPSNEAYYTGLIPPTPTVETVPLEAATPTFTVVATVTQVVVRARPTATAVQPAFQMVMGNRDPMGLCLQWKPLKGIVSEGHQLYKKSVKGTTEKLNRRPIPGSRVWLPEKRVESGSSILVTSLKPDNTELIVGVYTYVAPDEWESARPIPTRVSVKVEGRGAGARLDWAPDPKAVKYLVLVADPTDGIYWELGKTKDAEVASILELLNGEGDSIFVLVPEDEKGAWLTQTAEGRWRP